MCAVCRPPGTRPTYTAVFAAGCVAGAAQLSIAVPVDLVKVRLQAQQGETGLTHDIVQYYNICDRPAGRYRGPYDCLRAVHREAGLRGCYKGFLAQAWRDVKASGLYFLVYHAALDWAGPGRGQGHHSPLEIFLAGGLAGHHVASVSKPLIDYDLLTILVYHCVCCAGLLSWQAIIYADVVKSRLQADSFTRPRYSGTWDCVVQSYTRDGARVFCRGECRA